MTYLFSFRRIKRRFLHACNPNSKKEVQYYTIGQFSLFFDSINTKADHGNNNLEDGTGSTPCHNFEKPVHDVDRY